MATSYSNNGGTGSREPEIVVTSTFTSSAVDISNGASFTYEELAVMVDGVNNGTTLGAGGNARELGTGNNANDRNFTFDWGVNAAIVIDEMKVYITTTTNLGSNWTVEASNDNSSYTVLKTAFNLTANNGAATTISWTNSTPYRYYRLRSNTNSNFGNGKGIWSEFEFQLEDQTPQASRCSWFNSGGKGARSGNPITITTTLTFTSGSIGNVIDGDYTNNSSHAATLTSALSSKQILFDFGRPGYVVDTYFIWLSAASGASQGTWKLQGSPDNSTFTDLEVASNLINQGNKPGTKHTVVNSTGYRYYRLLQITGSTTAITITEIEFRVKSPGTASRSYAFILD